MMIPKLRLEFDEKFIENYLIGCREILETSMLTNATQTRLFEEKFARFIGTKYAVAVGSGTDALEVACRALNSKNKITYISDNTMAAQPMAVERAGGLFYPIDIETDTFALNPISLAKKIRHKDIVIITDIGGLIPKKIREIKQLCEEQEASLIEDAAHAHGSAVHTTGKPYIAGKLGDIGCFSFFPTKVMTTGEGGMATTNNEELYEQMKAIRNMGRRPGNDQMHYISCGNYKMTEFQALMGVLELKRIKRRLYRRYVIAERYERNLDKSFYHVVTQASCSYYKVIVLIKHTSGLVKEITDHCKRLGVSLTGGVYHTPIHQQLAFNKRFSHNNFPNSTWFAGHHICPPCYPEISLEEVDRVCYVLNRFVG